MKGRGIMTEAATWMQDPLPLELPARPVPDNDDRLSWPLAARVTGLLSLALWVGIWRVCAQLF